MLVTWSCVRHAIVEAVKKNRVLVLVGETGSGKTTQVSSKMQMRALSCRWAEGPCLIAWRLCSIVRCRNSFTARGWDTAEG
eukprot:4786276-Amphidinium_carterae.1